MVAFSKFALAAALTVGAMAGPLAPQIGPLSLFGELLEVPAHWSSQGPASRSSNIKAQIGLKQRNVAKLQAKLLDVANPDSANYGKWMSKEEIDAIVAPSAADIAAVKAWLTASGITEFSQPSPDWIEFTVPVAKMESLLDTKYENFISKISGEVVPRTTKYSVPSSLHGMIDMITPTTAFYNSNAPGISKADEEHNAVGRRAATCNTNAITPACIQSLYNVDYTSKGSQTVASTALIQIGASHSDYATFGRNYVPGLKDFVDISVSGGKNPGQGNTDTLLEGNLDSQYAGGLASPNPSQFLAIGPDSQDFSDQVANLASYLTSVANPPSSVSTSYGGTEDGFDASYLQRVCTEFMKAGSRGISIFFSSGDFGVAGYNEPSCNSKFYVQWPSSCPWVTSVGGTQFNGTAEVVAQYPETSGRGSTGGGYSSQFTVPDYQKNDTQAYAVGAGKPYASKFNANNRGAPDISLVSKQFQVYINNQLFNVYGTSASSPSWAALVSVLNDYRNSMGKPNLGFINPLLYSATGRTALRDVTAGTNQGCNSNGFSASKGWDPATGLGTLDFGKLRAML